MGATFSVACLLPDLDGGGAQRTMVNLAGEFQAAGLRTRLLAGRSAGPAKAWLAPDVPFVDLGAERVRRLPIKLIRALRSDPPDILFSTMIDANLAAALARPLLPSRPALVMRETNSQRARGDLGLLRRWLIRRAYPTAARVVALSEGVRQELIEDLRLDPARTVTIHNPLRLEPVQVGARPSGMPPGRCIVAAGRLTRQKNFPLLIDAMAALPSDVHLAILGDGPDREDLAARAAERGVADRVKLTGFVEAPGTWFAHAEIFALSSRWEGFGHVLIEAMAAGAPVVATDCPHGPRDIVKDGETGLLVDNDNVEALAAALNRLLENPDLRSRLAEAGKASVSRFTASRIAAEYRALFEAVLEER